MIPISEEDEEDMEEISIRSLSPPLTPGGCSSDSTETLAYSSSLVGSEEILHPSLPSLTLSDFSLRRLSRSPTISEDRSTPAQRRASVILLLTEIHDPLPSSDSSCRDVTTDTSTGRSHGWRHWKAYSMGQLHSMSGKELGKAVRRLTEETEIVNRRLLRALKTRTNMKVKVSTRCSIVSAALQAASKKRHEDSSLEFSLTPDGDEAQWLRAMKAATRINPGLPNVVRASLWVSLAERTITRDDQRELKKATSERLLDGDDEIHFQILKDLHRTGFEGFSNVKKLKQLLLAYARFNKDVGYCQGFNVIGALILQVLDFDVFKSLKVMVFLVDYVLPAGYFDQSLRALSVDMAVIKDLLHQRLPIVSKHLEELQNCSASEYEPPLTNVFSMHWLLTLFATCLPRECVYRIWDAVMLHGSEVLLRTAVAIWAKFGRQILNTKDVDDFYILTDTLTKRLLTIDVREQNGIISYIYEMAEFPYPGLGNLREHHTWNIQPITSLKSLDQLLDDDGPSCMAALCARGEIGQLERRYKQLIQKQKQSVVVLNFNSSLDESKIPAFNHLCVSPGSFAAPLTMSAGDMTLDPISVQPERMWMRPMESARCIQLGFLYGLPCQEDFEIIWKHTTLQRSKRILDSIKCEKIPRSLPMPPRKKVEQA